MGGGGVTTDAGCRSGCCPCPPPTPPHPTPPPPPPPPSPFILLRALQPDLHLPPGPHVPIQTLQPLLQAGQSDKPIAGPLARELAESISSQQTTADPSRSQILLLRETNTEEGACARAKRIQKDD
ncbi:hypothetical protein D9C73_001028 [Collichthys lucidus]|uniref:Uncharacterized protein n=1 Tax=Collichthys lucidus TaxID=240159 RepID=A0A4U5U1T8_COLLU|nr:hypothetical protein D9C73_001028 [Collichthys lucidus]